MKFIKFEKVDDSLIRKIYEIEKISNLNDETNQLDIIRINLRADPTSIIVLQDDNDEIVGHIRYLVCASVNNELVQVSTDEKEKYKNNLKEIYLHTVAILPQYQGNGYGLELLELVECEIENLARHDKTIKKIFLDTNYDNLMRKLTSRGYKVECKRGPNNSYYEMYRKLNT